VQSSRNAFADEALPTPDAPAAPDGGIPILRYATDSLPPEQRYRAWLRRDWPRQAQIYRTEPYEPFNTRWESAQLGLVAFAYVEISGMLWERRREDIRNSDFDPIIAHMVVEGEARGHLDGRTFHETSGMMHFHDLARPSLHTSSASRTYSVIVPRAVAQEWFGPIGALHGLVADERQSAMLISHATQIREALPRLDASAAAGLGRSLLELIAMVANELRPAERDRVTPEAALRQRAEEEIDRRLSTASASVSHLARALDVSRAKLFRAFQADGGVHAFIMDKRLDRAREAIGDADRAEPIGDIAHRLGFSDPSHLARLFRSRFGMTPRDYRRLVAANLSHNVEPG
jgi:AraC-like DNA-binding protein